MNPRHLFPILLALTSLVACAPTVRLDTPEPVKIDVAMRVDVYSHESPKPADPSGADAAQSPATSTPQQRQRLRMAEVQTLKNDLVIGEVANGLLAIVRPPEDPAYLTYAERIVGEENRDREAVFAQEAEDKGRSVEEIAAEFAKRRREGAFPGEWIQTPQGEWTKR
ncbi:MAG: hypothetical protein OHK005_05970 [Candidatus Methylacidiphilales bacterium]